MKAVLAFVKREPVRVASIVAALIALAAAFGFSLSDEQVGAIMAVVVILLGIPTRQAVTPNVRVAAKETAQGEVVTGPAAPPAGEPAAVVTSDDGTGLVDPDGVILVHGDKPHEPKPDLGPDV